jgi:hypothetical protein
LDTQVEGAHRAYLGAQLELASAMAIDPAKAPLPEPEGELQSVPMRVDLDSKRRRLYSEEQILNWRACSCALPTKINESSQPTIIRP